MSTVTSSNNDYRGEDKYPHLVTWHDKQNAKEPVTRDLAKESYRVAQKEARIVIQDLRRYKGDLATADALNKQLGEKLSLAEQGLLQGVRSGELRKLSDLQKNASVGQFQDCLAEVRKAIQDDPGNAFAYATVFLPQAQEWAAFIRTSTYNTQQSLRTQIALTEQVTELGRQFEARALKAEKELAELNEKLAHQAAVTSQNWFEAEYEKGLARERIAAQQITSLQLQIQQLETDKSALITDLENKKRDFIALDKSHDILTGQAALTIIKEGERYNEIHVAQSEARKAKASEALLQERLDEALDDLSSDRATLRLFEQEAEEKRQQARRDSLDGEVDWYDGKGRTE